MPIALRCRWDFRPCSLPLGLHLACYDYTVNVSVVIPALNEEHTLPVCLDALAAQTQPPYEVIVVDNGSTDKTADIARSYPFVRLIEEPKRGRVYARNAGFMAARGAIIARIDADAIVPSDWVAHIATYFMDEAHAVTAWTGGAYFYNVRMPRFISALYNWLVFRFNTLLVGHPSLWGSNMAVSAALWQAVADEVCLDNGLHEDLDLSMHVHRHGSPIFYDKTLPVRVQMRRVQTQRDELWAYLRMWPDTISRHGLHTAVVCWTVCLMLYAVSPLLIVFERVARAAGKQPLVA